MSRKLLVVPDADRVEQWLLDESRRAEFVDLRDTWTVSELLERLEPGAWARRAPADPLLVQMLFGKLAGEYAATAYGPAAHTAEFAAQARELILQLRGQGATARALEEAAGKLEDSAADRARALAELWRAVDAALLKMGLVDRGEWLSLAASRVNEWGLPAAFEVFEAIEIRYVHDVTPARLALFEALARAASSAGMQFAWRYPASGAVSCDAYIIEAVRAAEAKWQAVEVDLAPDVPEGPLAWVAPALFGEGAVGAAPELTGFCAPTHRDEVREIARRVRRLVSAGVPPEAICVAWRELAEDTEQLVEALNEVGVPVRARLGVPLTQSPNGRLALSLLELADEGFPADAVASLLESRAVKVLPDEAADPRAAFREAGIRDDLIGAAGGRGAYSVRLNSLSLRSGERGGERGQSSTNRRIDLLASTVEQLIDWCRAIPEQGPALELLESWWDAVTKLGLLEEVVPPAPLLSSELLLAELDRAFAREQAAVESLSLLLSSLRDALNTSGLATAFMTRREFTRWVRSAAGELNLAARGPRAGAVWLLDVRELAGRSFAQLFLGGLIDGRFPGRAAPMPLLSDEERLRLNSAAQKSLFRVSAGEGDVWLPLRLAEDRLLFHLALSSAASVTISRSRFDDSGRELLPSPFHTGLRRVVPEFIEERITRGAIPPLDEVQTESELRVRLALEALSPFVTRQSVPDRRAMALAEEISEEGWFERAREASQMEGERLRFFSDPSLSSGAFSGRVDAGVLDALQPRLSYDAAHPVAAHELHLWGSCAFKGLASMVLGLEAGEAAGEEMDSATRGSFWHEILAELVPELDRRGVLGRQSPETRELVEKAVITAARKTEQRSATGHPALWGIAREWAVTVIHRMVTDPSVAPFGLARPKFFEVAFGNEKKAPPPLREVKIPAARKGERDLFLTGRIDRVDVGAGVIGVVDYKTSVRRNMTRDFLVKEFQMAFYLLAARELLPGSQVNGAWHAVTRNQLTPLTAAVRGLSVNETLATDELTRARLEKEEKPNLANAVFKLVEKLRGGDFGARPIDCDYCELKRVCRISDRRLPEDQR